MNPVSLVERLNQSLLLSLLSMFQNCVMLRCSLWLFRSWCKSFFPDPVGTRSETWPGRPRLLEVRAKSMQNLLGHNAAWRGRSLQARALRKIRNTVKRRSCFPNKLLQRGSSSSLHGKSSRCVKLKSRNFGVFSAMKNVCKLFIAWHGCSS